MSGMVTKLLHRVLRPAVARREKEAARHGVPFEDTTFWPAYDVFKERQERICVVRNGHIAPDLYASKIGDVVPVLRGKDGAEHHYEVIGFSWASGDDHIVSPRQFHIRYHHTATPQAGEQG